MVVPKAERLMRGIFHHRVIYDSKLRDERLNMVKKKKKREEGGGGIWKGSVFEVQSWWQVFCSLIVGWLAFLPT